MTKYDAATSMRLLTSSLLFCSLLFSASLVPAQESAPTAAEKLFATQVKPLLAAKCFACHGGDKDKIEGELDLTTRAGMLKGGSTSNAVLVPGDAERSLLFVATTWKNLDLQMPPKENDRLTEEQTWSIRDWIKAGAPWPRDERLTAITAAWAKERADGVLVPTSGGLSEEWTNRRYKPENLWAYQPLRKPAVPANAASSNPIDAFLAAKWAESNLTPAPLADRRTLIRRVTYDLLGLPPTPDEVAAFIDDPAADDEALAKLVERLLASPHYGEQWGRHWLDVVRYADSSGFANDYERGNAWRYRDYVIRAFNQDKPFDQFIREQIAGDELDPTNPEMLVAAGFLRMGPWELTGMEVAKVARQRFLDDVTDSIGQVFLSHPLQCARCHDHKFDPIPTRDYYSLQAVFTTTQLAEREAAFLPAETIRGFEEQKFLAQRQAEFNRELDRLNEVSIAAARQWYAEQGFDVQPFEKLVAQAKGNGARQYEQIRNKLRQQGIAEDQIPPRHAGFTPEDYGRERIARKGLERLEWELERYEPIAFSVYSGRTPPLKSVTAPLRMPAERMTHGDLEQAAILAGGDPFSPTVAVKPGALSVLGAAQLPDEITGRRQALADWIASPTNPLTARSIANRIWQWHFGQGLAGNPNNFGTTGKKPTHPELLDWLAATLIEEGWSLKALHRHIIMSHAYRRSTEHPQRDELARVDPQGTSYAVFRPRRLTSEELRDSLLALSGELNREIGGIPARPEMNLEAALQPRMVMGTFAAAWQPSPRPAQRHRRSVYALKIRGLRDPFQEVFNEPSPENSCEARDASTVTPQVFSLFNSQASYDRALALAARLRRETNSPTAAVELAFSLVNGRPATPQEVTAGLDHWSLMTERHRTLRFAPTKMPTAVVREAVEENTGEKFQFTERLNFYDEFVPDLQPGDVDAETRGLAEVCLVLLNANEFVYVY